MVATAELTLEQFLARVETKPYGEYVCGEVVKKSMPSRLHAAIQTYLAVVLSPFLWRTGLGSVYTEFRCVFGPPGRARAYVPDLVFIAQDHPIDDPYLRSAPDLAVEVLSPRQDTTRLLRKIHFYLLHGVRLIWIVDPRAHTIAVFAPGQEERVLREGDVLEGGEVLPGFSIAVADVFAQTPVV